MAAQLLLRSATLLAAADYAAGARLPKQTTREIAAIKRSPHARYQVERLTRLILESGDAASFVDHPGARCYEAAVFVGDLLHKAGYTIRYRAMGIWDEKGRGMRNHVVPVAVIDGIAFLVDVTAHQFPDLGFDGPTIDIETNAMAKYHSNGAVLVKYRDFPTYERAVAFASFSILERAVASIDGATALQPFPDWYDPDAI